MRKLVLATLLVLVACDSREKPSIEKALGDENAVIAPGGDEDWAQVTFRIGDVHENRRLLDAAPWHAAGGDWIIAECKLHDERFLLGIQGSPWGKGVIIPIGDGEGLLRELSTVFDQPLPPRAARTEPLRPVIASTAILGTDIGRKDGGFGGKGSWTATKWFYEAHGRYAEVFVNVNFERGLGEISEKDPEYREDLIRQLTWALRDGPPPPRTPANDPNLVENGPRFTNLRTILPRRASFAAFDSPSMFHLTYENDAEETVIAVGDVSAPETLTEIWKTKGMITAVACRETKPVRCVVEETLSKEKGSYSSADPKKMWLVDAGAPAVVIASTWKEKDASLAEGAALSPDARFIAMGTLEERGKTREFITYVHDLQSGKTTTYSLAGDSTHFHAWEDGGKVLLTSGNSWEQINRALYRASVGSPALVKVRAIESTPSPNGSRAFTIDEEKGTLAVGVADTTRTFKFHPDDRGMASVISVRWLNDRYILFEGERPAFIDTDTMKMNYAAAPELSEGGVIASPDGRHVLYAQADRLQFAVIQ